jgi:hypothetical protein
MTTVSLHTTTRTPEVDTDYWPAKAELEYEFRLKYGDPQSTGWAPALMARFGYYSPDDHYEALVSKLVKEGQPWLDVGGGSDLFPHNPTLSASLSERSGCVVGVDPDETLDENRFLHERVRSPIEEFNSSRTFPLVTLRMVAEHIAQPERAVEALARLTSPGGHVVVYTINLASPLSWAAWLIPFRLHHPLKRMLWGTEEKETFPVVYKMNTRRQLRKFFAAAGFQERKFAYLSDCRTLSRFSLLFRLELLSWRFLRLFGLVYPENCLLGVYERV